MKASGAEIVSSADISLRKRSNRFRTLLFAGTALVQRVASIGRSRYGDRHHYFRLRQRLGPIAAPPATSASCRHGLSASGHMSLVERSAPKTTSPSSRFSSIRYSSAKTRISTVIPATSTRQHDAGTGRRRFPVRSVRRGHVSRPMETMVDVPKLGSELEGEARPGHFAVSRPWSPSSSTSSSPCGLFRREGLQQVAVIRRWSKTSPAGPGRAGADGARGGRSACSSRNVYLSERNGQRPSS